MLGILQHNYVMMYQQANALDNEIDPSDIKRLAHLNLVQACTTRYLGDSHYYPALLVSYVLCYNAVPATRLHSPCCAS